MSDTVIDAKYALQIARLFNLAFNNAFMFGGGHQTTKDSSANFYTLLQQALHTLEIITISVERGSVYLENHCVDKLVSVPRITSRLSKAGVQSVSFDRNLSLEGVQALFYMIGSLADFKDVEAMQLYLKAQQVAGVRLNYVVYQKITVDETIINKELLSENSLLNSLQAVQSGGAGLAASRELSSEIAELLSSGTASTTVAPVAESDSSLTCQIKELSRRFVASPDSDDDTPLSSSEMLESVYKLKETILENARIQQETGKLAAADELVINELNQISYQVIVRLIKEEYRNDKEISVKRLAQIIRRMLPDIKELRYLLPQLKDGLFAEGMPPADYLLLVKELCKELASDDLMQVVAEAAEHVGLSFSELLESIKDAPEEAARLIVLASEIKKGGVVADEQQMSALLSDYIEKVSRSLALQSPEVSANGGGVMLQAAVSRIEREIVDRLTTQNISPTIVQEVAQTLARQFTATVSGIKSDWLKSRMYQAEQPNEETVLSILEQVVEQGKQGSGVTEEIQTLLIARGYSPETIAGIIQKAQKRAALVVLHPLELPAGVHNAKNTCFFVNREIKLHARYKTIFSTMLISYERVVDPWTTAVLELTSDMVSQLTNQSLQLLKGVMKRDTDIIGVYELAPTYLPLMILPMTDASSALYIQKRLRKAFKNTEFTLNGIIVQVEPTISVLGYTKKLATETTAYLDVMYQHHCMQKP
ncbi:MAG: hypothetical protein LWW87_11350 [Geobacteraceae bacterium]|nr:hypothetical protein [Geobacteraceae bacterium]